MRFYHLILTLLLGTISFAFVTPVSAQENTIHASQACTPAQPSGWVEYSVQSGDTLSDIAASTGSTVDELIRVNCIVAPRTLLVDQRLFVPHLPDLTHNRFLRRCLNAGFTTQECRRIYNDLYGTDTDQFAERCLNAGYTPQQCRRIYNALFGDDNNLAERCRAAGLTPEQCRRLLNANTDDDLAERCRAAGLTPEECRRLINASSDDDLAERCRAAGLTPEECRRILNSDSDGAVEPPPVDTRPIDEQPAPEPTPPARRAG